MGALVVSTVLGRELKWQYEGRLGGWMQRVSQRLAVWIRKGLSADSEVVMG
jgi:hypothetical protein